MSDVLKTMILGIIQGLTEFLPVSSSGHLELGKYFLGTDLEASESLMLTVVLHFATALSTLFVFRKEVAFIIRGLFMKSLNDEKIFSFHIILSMIPAAIVGLFFEEKVEWFFSLDISMVAIMLMVTGILLIFADRAKNTERTVSWKDSIVVGLAQAIAIIPGISRSGATISASVIRNIDRTQAAKFSFLMVVPLIFGKILMDVISGEVWLEKLDLLSLAIGFVSAFITGWIACKWMILLVQKSQLRYFSYYCFIIATVTLVVRWLL